MNATAHECPVCHVRMEEGHLLGRGGHGWLERMKWIEGELEKNALGGYRLKGRRQIPTVTWRCPRCGWLLWFAAHENES